MSQGSSGRAVHAVVGLLGGSGRSAGAAAGGLLRHAKPALDRRARVALEERGRRTDQPGAGHGPVAVLRRIGSCGLRRLVPLRVLGILEQRQLLPLAEVRRGHPDQPDPLAPDLPPQQLQRGR